MKNSVYAKAAVLALVNWNGKTEEEARAIVASHTREEIEKMCYAEGAVRAGFEALVNTLRKKGVQVSELEETRLYSIVLDGDCEREEIKELGARAEGLDRATLALEALTEIHDNWVRGNVSKFDREDRQSKLYMHMPLEAIGWGTVELDYIFLKPLMESMGIEVEEEKVRREYDERCTKFWCEEHPVSDWGFYAELQNPELFYPALSEYPISKFNGNRALTNRIFEQINSRVDKSYLKGIYSEKKMAEGIDALHRIDKESMDERTFYEEVLKVIKSIEHVTLTDERATLLKETLISIGCKTYAEWAEEKERQGTTVEEGSIGDGLKKGRIGTAVSFVAQLLSSTSNAQFSLPYICDGWVEEWIQSSQKIERETTKKLSLVDKAKALAESLKEKKTLETTYTEIVPEVHNESEKKEGEE